MTQGVNEQIGAFPAVEAEGHFVQVGLQVFGADLVPRSDDPALQERECGFDRVSRDASAVLIPSIFFGSVVNSFVFQVTNGPRISRKIVSDNYFNILADVLLDIPSESTGTGVTRVEESQIAIALPNADHNLLRFHGNLDTLPALATANVGFIHFYSTVKHGLVYFLHGSTDAMTEVPCRLVGAFVEAPDCALELTGAHALLGFAEEQDGHKPERQCQMGIIENRAGSHGELIAAFATGKLFTGVNPPHVAVFAARAFDAFGPSEPGQNLTAIFVSGVHPIQFRERHD